MTMRVSTEQELQHPPAVSGTPTAWLTLFLLLVAGLLWVFARPLSCMLIRGGLSTAAVWRGDHLTVGDISWTANGSLQLKNIEWRGSGSHPDLFRSDWISVQPQDPGLFLGGHRGRVGFVRELLVGRSSLLVDRRSTATTARAVHGDKRTVGPLPMALLPDSFSTGPMDVVVVGDRERFAFRALTLGLPERWTGRLSYDEGEVEVGAWRHQLPKASAPILREGPGVRIGAVDLGDGIGIGNLDLKLAGGRCEFGFRGLLGKGLLRGDGSVELARPEHLDLTLVGESLSLGVLNELFGLGNRATGEIRQARLTFRGMTTRPLDADGSLRLIARDFHWEGRGWEALRLSASLTGRKLTLGELELHQADNLVTAEGESFLPQDWHEALQAPFTADFHASLEDAGSLASLAGRIPGLPSLSGAMELEGRVRGSSNRAEGYCNLAGWGMKVRDLPVDWIRGCLLFEGDRTKLTYLEARSGQDRLAAEGEVSHVGSHAYKGQATLGVRDLTRRLAQIGVSTAPVIGGGACNGSWKGEGELSGDRQSGSFRAEVTEWVTHWTQSGMSGSFEGSYGPGRLQLDRADFFQDDLKLSMKLNATRDRLTATGITATRKGEQTPLVEGSLDLPLDVAELWRSADLVHTLRMADPLSIGLGLHGIRAEELAQLFGQQAVIEGFLEGRIDGTGSLSDPAASLSLKITGFTPRPGKPSGDLHVAAYALHHDLGVWFDESRAGKNVFSGRLGMPLPIAFDGTARQASPMGTGLFGDLTVQSLEIDDWLSLAGEKGLPLHGCTVGGYLGFSGSVNAPLLTGSIEAQADSCDLPGLDPLDKLSARLDFLPNRLAVSQGAATYLDRAVGFGGELANGAEGVRGSLRASGKDLCIPLWQGLIGRGDAALEFQYTGSKPTLIKGEVLVKGIPSPLHPRLAPGLVVFQNAPVSTPTRAMEGAALDLALRTSSPLPAGTGSDPALLGIDLHGSGTVADPVWTGEITVRNLNVQASRTPAYLPYATFRLGKNGATLSTCDLYAVTRGGMERFVLTGSSTVATIHPPVPALEDLLLGDGVRRDMVPGRRRGIVPSPSGLYEADGTARLAFAPWWVRSLCLGTETFSRPGAAGFSDLLEPVPMDGGLPGFTGSWTITQPIPERKP